MCFAAPATTYAQEEQEDIKVDIEGKFCIKRDANGHFVGICFKGKAILNLNAADKILKKAEGILKKGFNWLKGRFKKSEDNSSLPTDNTNQFAVSTVANGLNETLILTPNTIIDSPGSYGDIDFVFEVDPLDFSLLDVGDIATLEFVFELEDVNTGEITLVTQEVDIPVEECLVHDIPTLSQWSLIILSLLMLIIGVIGIKNKSNEPQPSYEQ